MDGFAFAAEAFVGQALGARNRVLFRKSAIMTSQWGFGSVVVMAIIFAVFGSNIIDVMTTAENVREVSREYLPWMVLAPLVGAAAWMLDGIFIGATRTADMRNMMFISFCVYLLMLALFYLNMKIMDYGHHSLFFQSHGELRLGFKYPKLEASVERIN